MDRRSRRHLPDQTTWWEHVCRDEPLHSLLRLTSKSTQIILSIRVYHRLHIIPAGHRFDTQRLSLPLHCADPCLYCPCHVVTGCWCQHPRWIWGGQEQARYSRISALPILHQSWLPMPHHLLKVQAGASSLQVLQTEANKHVFGMPKLHESQNGGRGPQRNDMNNHELAAT